MGNTIRHKLVKMVSYSGLAWQWLTGCKLAEGFSYEVALLILIIVLKSSFFFIFTLFHGIGSDVILHAGDPRQEGVLPTYYSFKRKNLLLLLNFLHDG